MPFDEKDWKRKWYAENRGKVLQKQHDYYREKISLMTPEEKKEWNAYRLQIESRARAKLKGDVIRHYSNGTMTCLWCGFGDIRALSIDHINGNGAKEKRDKNWSGAKFYVRLRQLGYPEGYQVLCMNCQWIKRTKNEETRKYKSHGL